MSGTVLMLHLSLLMTNEEHQGSGPSTTVFEVDLWVFGSVCEGVVTPGTVLGTGKG